MPSIASISRLTTAAPVFASKLAVAKTSLACFAHSADFFTVAVIWCRELRRPLQGSPPAVPCGAKDCWRPWKFTGCRN
jgi:hypothetical protein